MSEKHPSIFLRTPYDTDLFGARLAGLCQPGDCVLLVGQIGAGKSAIARALIRARIGEDTEVPSPTFTLVQTYQDSGTEIWHADLYRLSDPSEVLELGLLDDQEDRILLIEWPDLIDDLLPDSALTISLIAEGDGRRATFSGGGSWLQRLAPILADA